MFVWDIDPNVFHLPDFIPGLGGRGIRYYGLLYATMLMGGFYIWQWQMVRGGHTREQAEKFLTLGVVAIIGGARLGHCLFYEPERYLSDPIRILYFWEGGLASHGSTIALILALFWFARSEKMPAREILDRFSISTALGASLVRLGNFMNSEIVCRVTDGPFKVKFPRYEFSHGGARRVQCSTECGLVPQDVCHEFQGRCLDMSLVPWRHPSQLYEFFMGMFVLIVLVAIDRKYGEKRPLGLMGFTFLFLYFSGRFAVEFVKEFQSLSADRSLLTMGQYLSIPFIIFGLLGIVYSIQNHKAATPEGEA